jgi:hypothetical protein
VWDAPASGPAHAVDAPPKPVWPTEPARAVEPPQIPDWGRAPTALSDARWEHASEASPRPWQAPSDPAARRTRAFKVTIVLASLVVVLVAVAIAVTSLHHPTSRATSPAAPSTSAVSSSDVAQVRAATAAADAATTKARNQLHALTGWPTVTHVARVINPYVAALERYNSVLTMATVPESARTAAVSADVLVARDMQSLSTINELPALKLGTYLQEFTLDAAQLQTNLANLQQKLHPSNT